MRKRSVSYSVTLTESQCQNNHSQNVRSLYKDYCVFARGTHSEGFTPKLQDLTEQAKDIPNLIKQHPAGGELLNQGGIQGIPGFSTRKHASTFIEKKHDEETRPGKSHRRRRSIGPVYKQHNSKPKQTKSKSRFNSLFLRKTKTPIWKQGVLPRQFSKTIQNMHSNDYLKENLTPNMPLPSENLYLVLSAVQAKYSSLKQLYDEKTKTNEETFRKQRSKVDELTKTLAQKQSKVDELTTRLAENQKDHYERVESLMSQIHNIQTKNKELSSLLKEKDEAHRQEMEKVQNHIELSKKVKNDANVSVAYLNENMERCLSDSQLEEKDSPFIKDLREQHISFKKEIEHLKLDRDMLASQKSSFLKEKATLVTEVSLKVIDLEKAQKDLEFANRKLEQLNQYNANSNTVAEDNENVIAYLTKSRDEALTLVQELSIKNQEVENQMKRCATRMKAMKKDADLIMEQEKSRFGETEVVSKERDRLNRENKILQSQLSRLKLDKQKIQEHSSTLQAKAEVQEEQILNFKSVVESNQIRENQLQEAINRLEADLEETRRASAVNAKFRKSFDVKEFSRVIETNKKLAEKFASVLSQQDEDNTSDQQAM